MSAMAQAIHIDAASAARALEAELRQSQRTVVLTGAGLSTESGIPDFRSPGGLWSQMRPIEFDDFISSERARQEDWRRRFEMADLFARSEPNAAHRAIAHLAADGPVTTVVTQNIDGLHRRAGTPAERLIEIHGTGDHARCLDCGLRHEIADAERLIAETGVSPRCTRCGGLVKAAIISFGEAMPEAAMRAAQEAAAACDLLIAAGTSLVVYPAASLPLIAHGAGARIVIASREATEQDEIADISIRSALAATFAPLESLEFA